MNHSHKSKTFVSKALFLDRDGVLNHDNGYTHVWSPKLIIKDSIKLIKKFNQSGYLVIVVTNQSGIGRKYYTEKQLWNFMKLMIDFLSDNCARIDDYFYCSCNPKEKECFNRKPNPGMFLSAIDKHRIDPHQSFMVGDKISDMVAAEAANVSNRYLFDPFRKIELPKSLDNNYHILDSLRRLKPPT